MNKEISELQQKFLEALFGEAKGDPSVAKKIAGYAETTKTIDIVRALRDEITEQAKLILAIHGPKAAFELVSVAIDPMQPGATTKLKAVESILDRVGVSQKSQASESIDLKVPQSGLFIMPAKGSQSLEDAVKGSQVEKEITDAKG